MLQSNKTEGISSTSSDDIKGGRALKYYSQQILDIRKLTNTTEYYPPSNPAIQYSKMELMFRKNAITIPLIPQPTIFSQRFNSFLTFVYHITNIDKIIDGKAKLSPLSTRMSIREFTKLIEYTNYDKNTINIENFGEDLLNDEKLLSAFIRGYIKLFSKIYNTGATILITDEKLFNIGIKFFRNEILETLKSLKLGNTNLSKEISENSYPFENEEFWKS